MHRKLTAQTTASASTVRTSSYPKKSIALGHWCGARTSFPSLLTEAMATVTAIRATYTAKTRSQAIPMRLCSSQKKSVSVARPAGCAR